jgi:hypothetical protein
MTSLWQIKAGFIAQREPTPEPTKTNLNEISRPSEGAPIGAPEPKQKGMKSYDSTDVLRAIKNQTKVNQTMCCSIAIQVKMQWTHRTSNRKLHLSRRLLE